MNILFKILKTLKSIKIFKSIVLYMKCVICDGDSENDEKIAHQTFKLYKIPISTKTGAISKPTNTEQGQIDRRFKFLLNTKNVESEHSTQTFSTCIIRYFVTKFNC